MHVHVKEIYEVLGACVNCDGANMQLAQMPLIVTAVLSKQQLWSEAEDCHLHPGTPLTDPRGIDSKLREAMSILTVRCCRSQTEGLPKQLDRFPFQVYLKSSRAAEVITVILSTNIYRKTFHEKGVFPFKKQLCKETRMSCCV